MLFALQLDSNPLTDQLLALNLAGSVKTIVLWNRRREKKRKKGKMDKKE